MCVLSQCNSIFTIELDLLVFLNVNITVLLFLSSSAVVDLNGRYFGGRVVKACFYNLDKFRVLDLGDQMWVGDPDLHNQERINTWRK